jgi:hypothetical protein
VDHLRFIELREVEVKGIPRAVPGIPRPRCKTKKGPPYISNKDVF